MALSSARPWRPRPRDYDGKIITASSLSSSPAPRHRNNSRAPAIIRVMTALLWPSEVLMVICNYYTCFYLLLWTVLSQLGPRESLHYVPNGSLRRIFFIFPKHWRHQAVSAPVGSGASPGQEEPAAEEMGNVTAKNFKHRGFSLKLRSGETSVVMFNI